MSCEAGVLSGGVADTEESGCSESVQKKPKPSAEVPTPLSTKLSFEPACTEPRAELSGAEQSAEPLRPLSVGLSAEPPSAEPASAEQSAELSGAELSAEPMRP